MANTFEQKYPVNTRIISGLVNVPYQDDVVLLCNTAAGPVGIQLLQIPLNSDNKGVWSTQYKLYIVDNNNNAAANNITVTAPPGYLINGAGSFVISANNASLIVRITSNTTYAGQYSVISGGGGSAYNQVQDEGVNLIQRTVLNFTGAGVTVIDNGGKTEVQIAGGGGGGYNLIQDEGVPLPAQTTIDFVGAGVVVTDGPGAKTTVTIAGGGGAGSFLFARKNLNDPLTVYVPHTGNTGTRSVASAGATVLNAFDSKTESGITGFNLAGGDWTVDADGWYSLSAKLITRINPTDVDNNVDGGGLAWTNSALFDDGQGFIGIALIQDGANIICSNKQFVTNKISDVNIDCSVEAVQLVAGQRIRFHVINWTDHDVIGHAYGLVGVPECQVQIAIKKVA